MRPFLLWLLALLAFSASAAHAEFPSRPSGPIYDGADMIPAAEEAALDARLREFNARTGNAVIVATIPSIAGDTIESYSTHLFETWGIGGKERDAGVLLIVAKNERKVRIEVGYGLHPYITDILSGRIVRTEITPRFKQGDFAGGIKAGVDQITAQLERSPLDAKAVAEAAAAAERNRARSSGGIGIGSIVFWTVLVLFLLLLFSRGLRRRGFKRHGYQRGIDLWDIGEIAANVAINVAVNSVFDGDGGGGGGGSDGGFGGFGGGMSGGGGASGDW